MPYSYSIAGGCEATYSISPTGNTSVTVRSTRHLKPRAVYAGAANMDFTWVHTDKTTHWQFTPTIIDNVPAEFNMTQEGDTQVFDVNLGNKMFPATGIIKTNLTGEIRAPAVHFDLPMAIDLWFFIFRSPWGQFRLNVEKSPLNIAHGNAQASAEVRASAFDEAKSLRIDASTHGEGFKQVYVSIQRRVNRASLEETLGELAGGAGSFLWTPFVRNFDVVLSAQSNMDLNSFVGFLNTLGANARVGFFTLGNYMQNDFLLCDSPAMEYNLLLKGEKRFIGHEEDRTRITLNY